MANPSKPPSNKITSTLTPPLTRTTHHLAHLTRILSTTPGLDQTLLTLTYTLHLLHARLLALSTRRLARTASVFASKLSTSPTDLSTLQSGETLIATIASAPASRLGKTVRGIGNFTALVDDVRVFLRLWGLLGIWAWGARVVREPPSDAVLRRIAWLQVGANAVYQCLENGAYLASHGVFGWSDRKVDTWYLWSSRFWVAHVGLEFGRLGREWVLRKRVAEGRGRKAEDVDLKIARIKDEGRWWRELYVNAAYAPLSVHYSVDGGWVGEDVVGFLGMVAGGVGFRELWEETA